MGKANPNRMNGVNKVAYQLATKQAEAGIQVQVWGFTKDLSKNYGQRNFSTKLFLAKSQQFWLDPSFTSALSTLDPHNVVFHIHGGWVPLFFKASKALKTANIKYVITPHGAYNTRAMTKSKWKKKLYFQLYEKALLKNAKAVHCIGTSEVDGLNTIYKSKKSILLPYGMEFNVSKSLSNVSGDKLIFGFVGRLDYYTKGLDLMIAAFAQNFANDPSVELWVIGDGEGRELLAKRINELQIEKNVILFGSKYGDVKDLLVKQMNVFLHPSRNEGMPSAVLEAAAMNVPCIVTEATNIGQYIREHNAGFVIPNEDIPSLALTMFHCANISKERLMKMGENASKMVISQFNWTKIVTQFNQLYV